MNLFWLSIVDVLLCALNAGCAAHSFAERKSVSGAAHTALSVFLAFMAALMWLVMWRDIR